MKQAIAIVVLLAGCAGMPPAQTTLSRVHDALERGKRAYGAVCEPKPLDVEVCADLKEALNSAVELWNMIPESDEE